MQQKEVRSAVTAQFYQSLAESGVEVTAIPQAQMQAIVNALADGLIAGLAALDDQDAARGRSMIAGGPVGVTAAALSADDDEAESLLWSGRPYLSIGTRYELTSQRLRIIRGIFGRDFEETELVRVRDTSVTQHLGERALDIGDVTVVSNDPQQPQIVLRNIKDPVEVREIIRKATLLEKERRNLAYREEM
jgi:hypothetical protein